MQLFDIVARQAPQPWVDGEKIPWNDPDFSARMLREHLTQEHDAASRRFSIIDHHVAWIHGYVLQERPARILDLGCGPGFYLNRLARFGHTGVGIDFSPASFAYADADAKREGLPVEYRLADLRTADFGGGYDLAMLLFGEFNTFRPAAANAILRKAFAALNERGCILLEPSVFGAVQAIGEQPPHWYANSGGLFSAAPHLCLQDNAWDKVQRAAIERFAVVDAQSGEVTQYGSTTQAYTDSDYREFILNAGFARVEFYPSLLGKPDPDNEGLMAIAGYK